MIRGTSPRPPVHDGSLRDRGMIIERHFIEVDGRKVHLRVAGRGPAVLLVHQSPRSSAEYEPLMRRWAGRFTCIAADTPGFGQSDPLPRPEPDIGDYADALLALLDVLGLTQVAAYGFHSGSVILVEAARRDRHRFSALALGGYAFWSAEEAARFEAGFLPPLTPTGFGEHLAWLWNRILEQTWFFPWHDRREGARLPAPHDDPVEVQAIVDEMLAAGDAYRKGYGAVVRAPRDLSDFRARETPVLLAAYRDDPLFKHLERLASLPASWRVAPVDGEDELLDGAGDHLARHARAHFNGVPAIAGEGFVTLSVPGFSGRIRWRGARTAARIVLHAPGEASDLLALAPGELAIDLPGHGLSDPPADECLPLGAWADIVRAALARLLGEARPAIAGEGASALLALAVAARSGAPRVEGRRAHLPPPGQADAWRERAFPDLSPARFGEHLHRAWGAVRARQLFWPWFAVGAGNAIPVAPDALEPDRLAQAHLALLRARSGRALLHAVLSADRAALLAAAPPLDWHMEEWAHARGADHPHPVWHPMEG